MLRNLIQRSLCLSFIAIIFSCNSGNSNKLNEFKINNLNGETVTLFKSNTPQRGVFFFLSPECPFCINYTKTITDLISQPYSGKWTFYAVYPGTTYSGEDISAFQKEYDFHITALLDVNNKLTKMLGATVTPQCIIIDDENEIVYSGAIDNWAYDTGKKRRVISKHYVEDALLSLNKGQHPAVSKTEPIGCFIEL